MRMLKVFEVDGKNTIRFPEGDKDRIAKWTTLNGTSLEEAMTHSKIVHDSELKSAIQFPCETREVK